jgi:hypothetical protein
VAGKVGFSNAERTWGDEYNLVTLAASVLAAQGHQVMSEESWLVHQDSGFILLPQFVYLQPLDKGGVRTTTTIQAHHPVLVSEGIFEYQHSTWPRLSRHELSAAEGAVLGCHQDRIRRLPESRVECTLLQIVVQNH